MKTDSIFYRLFQIYPATLFDLLGLPAQNAQGYEFRRWPNTATRSAMGRNARPRHQ